MKDATIQFSHKEVLENNNKIAERFTYRLLMSTNRTFDIKRLFCFAVIIYTLAGVVMATMTRIEPSTAGKLDTTQPLIMFT